MPLEYFNCPGGEIPWNFVKTFSSFFEFQTFSIYYVYLLASPVSESASQITDKSCVQGSTPSEPGDLVRGLVTGHMMEGVERLTSWSGDPGDSQAPTQRTRKTRSLSLPGPGPGLPQDSRYMKTLPSLSEVQSSRGGWEKLGLYMTGLPPKQSAKEPRWTCF